MTRNSLLLALTISLLPLRYESAVIGEEEPDKPRLMHRESLMHETDQGQIDALRNARIELLPVIIPDEGNIHLDNNHYGWPVACLVDNTLIVAYHRLPYHGAMDKPGSTPAMIIRSSDGGTSWSKPVDIKSFGVSDEPIVINFGNALGVHDGVAYLANRHGLYQSADKGESWQLIPGALSQNQTNRKGHDNCGPRIISHPQRGLVIAVGNAGSPSIDMLYSTDLGTTWKWERHPLDNDFHPLEPTFIYHNERLIFLSRNHTLPFRGNHKMPNGFMQNPTLMVSATGWFPMTVKSQTNIVSHRWPDTTAFDFNELSGRYEAVVSNRQGGGPGQEHNEALKSLHLWSISPEDLYAGQGDKFVHEQNLLQLKEGCDAFHPGGAVYDFKKKYHFIFVYAGESKRGPSGVYLIRRKLNAEKLKTVVVIGQSNAVGRRTRRRDLDESYRALENVCHFSHQNAQAGRDLPRIPFVNEGKWQTGLKAQSDYIGPEFGFCKAWKGPIGLVKFTCGATSICKHWRPRDRSEQGLTTRLINLLNKVRESKAIEIVAILWNQGENDSQDEQLARVYEENLDALIERLRDELDLPDVPFLAARINPPIERYPHASLVRKAQEKERSHYAWIDLDNLQKCFDKLHYNASSQLEQGRLFFEAHRNMRVSRE